MLFVNFTFHLHQPLGNFDFVIDKAFADAYDPLVNALTAHPTFRCTLHVSGCLFDHLNERHPEFVSKLQKLCARGQIELLASGYHEPILCEIPFRDAVTQVSKMRAYLHETFNQKATGFWCTERIYDTNLPEIAEKTGMAFTLLDDYLMMRELDEEELYRHHVVNEGEYELAVFPISEKIRYLVPFQPVANLAAYLKEKDRVYTERGIEAPIIVFGDDGEKFGVWPGTKDWVYGTGWMESFLTFFEENAEQFPLVHLGEFFAVHPPAGIVALPSGSYREMCEWVLPVRRQRELARAKRILAESGIEHPEQVLFSGNFKFFYRKYEETRRLHHKNRYVSNLVQKAELSAINPADKEIAERARKHLLRSQCNCAYWHGVFGGLYLNYLREAINEQMIKAETAADEVLRPQLPAVETLDFYEDRHECVHVRTDHFSMLVSPDRGLAIDYADYHPATMTLLAGMGRYYEYYHDQIFAPQKATHHGPHTSIHESVKLKDGEERPQAAFDAYPRLNFIDMFSQEHTSIGMLEKGQLKNLLRLWEMPYLPVVRANQVSGSTENALGVLEKCIAWEGNVLTVTYRLRPASGTDGTFISEFNLNLLTDQGGRWASYQDEKLELKNAWEAEAPDNALEFFDEYRKVRIQVQPHNLSRLGFYPVRTLAMSEGGAALTYQAQAVALFREIRSGDSVEFGLSLTVLPI
jgi:hypothetical protein